MDPLVGSGLRMILRFAFSAVLPLAILYPGWTPSCAQQTASIHGEVLDPAGARIPDARVTLRPERSSSPAPGAQGRTARASGHGEFALTGLRGGTYALSISAGGFRTAQSTVHLAPGQHLSVAVTLEIAIQRQSFSVSRDVFGSGLSPDPGDSFGATTVRGSDLNALGVNSQQLRQMLMLMSGSDVEPQFYVDGFTVAHLPPTSSIAAIHMDQDPYSAEYETPGAERIQIVTKPGGGRMHGSLEMFGEDSALNSGNPFVENQPGYGSFFSQGSVSGPLTRTSSWSFYAGHNQIAAQSFTHAVVALNTPPFTQTLSSPEVVTEVTPRVDFQIGPDQIVTLRVDAQRLTQDNLLADPLSLASQAADTRSVYEIYQASDTQTWTPRLVNVTRFQLERDNNSSLPVDGSPSILVEGAFNDGGSLSGQSHDGQNHFEFENLAALERGNHLIEFGGRLRVNQEGSTSTSGFNGQFLFPSLQAYGITAQGLAAGLTPAQIRAAGGGASQYVVTAGEPKLAVNVMDLGAYLEDQWRVTPRVTLTPGLRYETQTEIPDHADFAPRLSVGWSLGGRHGGAPWGVLRAGAGLFYQRFAPDLVLNEDRQNGVLEQQYVVQNPDFYPNPPAPDALGPATLPTIYRPDPRLHAPSLFQTSVELDKQLFKNLSVSAAVGYFRGIDLLLTRNINAPLAGTFNPAVPTSGVRPLGTLQNVYQYQSEGASKRVELSIHARYQTQRVVIYGQYFLQRRNADTAGANSFPSQQYNLNADWGRAANDLRNRGWLAADLHLPWNFVADPFLLAQSGAPFNITVGQDLNGDSQYNDRPAFATDLSRASVYRTPWGVFDADPLPTQKIIPINYGKGPSLVILNLSLSRSFGFGPRPPRSPGARAKAAETRPATVSFGLIGQNILNTVNAGTPVGVLGSPIFGRSTNLAATAFTNPQANRIIYLHMNVAF